MSKLSDQDKSFIKLILRSPDTSEGWRTVTENLWKFTESPLFNHPDLLEREKFDNGGGRIRLTPEGNIVAKYLI